MTRPAAPSRRVAALVLALAAALARAASAREGGLAVEVRTPVFAGGELTVELRQNGGLAGRPLAVQLVVDGVSVGRFETTGDLTLLRARPAGLAAGRHRIAVKTGTVRAEREIRVWPAPLPMAVLGALLLVGGGAGAALLRRRRRRAD